MTWRELASRPSPDLPDFLVMSDIETGGQHMNLKPLGDRVIVKPADAEEKTQSGLFIPDTAKEKPQRGEVVAVGDGKLKEDGTRVAIDVKVGDTVIFSKYGGSEVKIDGVEYKILDAERDIIAVVVD